MQRDRTAELLRIRQELQEDQEGNGNDGDGDEDGPPPSDGGPTVVIQMDRLGNVNTEFFKQVEDARELVEEMTVDVERVRKLQSTILSSPIPDDRAKQELDQLMNTIKTASSVIRSKLKDIERMVSKEEDESEESGIISTSLRMRKTQHSSLLRSFVEIMTSYQLAQTEYRDRCKGRIHRQLEISGSSYTDDEVEKMIEDGNWSVFTQGIIQETEQARQMLADIEARHSDIIKLEKSIRELHEMFLEMAVLIESQGEVIDRIETHVGAAQDHVHRAEKDLDVAVESQGAARRKKIYIIIFLVIVLLVLGFIIYFTA